jgi:hypothetical protein
MARIFTDCFFLLSFLSNFLHHSSFIIHHFIFPFFGHLSFVSDFEFRIFKFCQKMSGFHSLIIIGVHPFVAKILLAAILSYIK